ncbi:hypothetical protein KTH81_04760 [Lachnospiraceae bacterium ASD3451]|uniref:hypothetical protein n=1 Tax=Diplocloster agilis TaxID=2850323 RepID=UPI001D6B3803|nr:hypothetical protein [Diplocloster agilis]MBU9743127.1 hypothetical protein [Diplocloster agilis]
MSAAYGLEPRAVSGDAAGFFCISLGAHRAAVNTLCEIGKPDSGCTADFTSDGQEPLNREHFRCSW